MSETQDPRPHTQAILAHGEPSVRNALRTLATEGLGIQVVAEAERLLTALRGPRDDLRIVVLGLRPESRHQALAAGADAYASTVDAPDVVARVLLPTGDDISTQDIETKRRSASAGDQKTNEPRGLS